MARKKEKVNKPMRGGLLKKLYVNGVKMLYRDKVGLFWALAFPLLFVLVFGLMFGGSSTIGTVTIVDMSKSPQSEALIKAYEDSQSFKLQLNKVYTPEQAKQAIKDDKTSFVIVIPKDFALASGSKPVISAFYSSGDVTVRGPAMSVLSEFVNRATISANRLSPIATVQTEKTSQNKISFFDLVYIGILCLALMNYNMTSFASQLTAFREQKILKRLQTTPLKVQKFVTAQLGSFLTINVFQIVILLLIGVGLFKAHIYGGVTTYASMIAILILGALIFLTLGFLVASVAKTNNAATGMATSISIVMMFLSGVFFSIQNLPNWAYQIVRWLPLSPMIIAMRNVALNSMTLASQWTHILLMLLWFVAAIIVTSFTFKFVAD